jgi:hypothetical protein
MEFPDESKNRRGFNPIEYPDLEFAYRVSVRPEGKSFFIRAELEQPLPNEWLGRVGFNLELFPGFLFGKNFWLDGTWGVFPRQANGPGDLDESGEWQIEPLAHGRKLVVAPEDDRQRLTIEALSGGDLQLIDGRGKHNNGWFVVRSLVEADGVVEWLVSPHAIDEWVSEPVIQVSQVGYHPKQPKLAVVELDRADDERHSMCLLRINENGEEELVLEQHAEEWGQFLRYHYLRLDFSAVSTPGLYVIAYGVRRSVAFRITEDIFDRGVWQPTVEYYLPVQMCHMRVVENYRVWHGECHLDDALMAPVNHNHFDGYIQGSSTLCSFKPGELVPGLDVGGWHDAGDYDLRIESQADTVYGLALAYELFGLDYDNTTVDQSKRLVEMLRPDGKPDVLQQVEHGCLSIVGGYRSLGRLYRGIIEPTLEQYVHLGDAATQTDNVPSEGDDRWVFTEEHPGRELGAGAALAAAARALKGFNDPLAQECFSIAVDLYERTVETDPLQRYALAVELLQSTGEDRYRSFLLDNVDAIAAKADRVGWIAARSLALVADAEYERKIRASLEGYRAKLDEIVSKTPYGLPYEPDIWGAGWGIQRMGVQQFWLHTCCPDLFPSTFMFNAVSFILGCHPGPNTTSFVSGVGAKSLIPGYGVNRADWSYIPGGIGSGTALIRPDYPELLEFPYLWQQTEYCMGNATSDYVFLIAAAMHLLKNEEP